ncbi:hypothetical protein E5E45_03235 [Helicobacter pylori]|nr:hypothetical protein E5E45_03235 [Helicobacter pylori]
MKLYNKIQELITESESLKQKSNEVLGLARNELSELVNTKAKENLESLKNQFQGYLNGQLVEMPLIIKKNVKELVNNEALSKEIHNELLSQFDKQAITNALTSKILGILESKLNAITESVIKNLDFSFLSAQPKAFYSVINQNLKEIFLKELESEFLKKYIKEAIDNALKETEKLKALRLAELKALCYLQVTLESHKVQLLQNALMIETNVLNNKMKIENEIAYNLKRKELIEEGKLEDEAFKKYIFKVI